MKRLLTTLLLLLSLWAGASAQKGLEINKVFGGKYVSDPSVTETLMSGEQRFLRSRGLTTLATFRGDSKTYAPILQPLVLTDGSHATGRNIRYRNGKLQYAFFILKPTEINGKTIKRYLYYLNNEKAKRPSAMLIYFEGTLSRSQAESLIRSLRK